MSSTRGQGPDPAAAVWPIFLCYRAVDGTRTALWLWSKLDGRPLGPGEEGPRLSVYFDKAAEARGSWSSTHLPFLQSARAFVFLCTPGSYSRLPGVDWVYRELDWWLENRPTAEPIVVETSPQGGRWVPREIGDRWPGNQRVTILSDWSDEDRSSRETAILAQILKAVRPSEEMTRFQDLRRLERINARLRLAVAALSAVAVALVIATGFARQFYVKEQQAAAGALASKKVADDKASEALASRKVADDKASEALASERVANQQKGIAERRSRVLDARRLAAEAVNALSVFPQRAVLLAIEAVRATRDSGEPIEPAAESALRDVLRSVEGSVWLDTGRPIASFALVPGGRGFITLSYGPGGGFLLHGAEGPPIALPLGEEIVYFAIDPTGRWMVAWKFWTEGSLLLWDLDRPRQPPVKIPGLEGMVGGVQFHPDGRRLVALDRQLSGPNTFITTLKTWDTGRPESAPSTLRGHYGVDDSLIVSGGRFALSAGRTEPPPARDGAAPGQVLAAIWSWDLQRPGDEPALLSSRASEFVGPALSPDGRRVAIPFHDRIEIRDPSKPRDQPVKIPISKVLLNRLSFLADGRIVVEGTEGPGFDQLARRPWLRLHDPGKPDSSSALPLPPEATSLRDLLTSPGVRSIVVAPYEEINSASLVHAVYLIDPDRPGDPPIPLRGHEGHITRVATTPDGKGLVTSGTDGTIRRWDLERPSTQPLVFRGHAKRMMSSGVNAFGEVSPGWQGIVASAISPDGLEVATADIDGVVRIWGLGEPARLAVLPAKALPDELLGAGILTLAYHPGGKGLIIANADGVRRLGRDRPDAKPVDLFSFPGLPSQVQVGPDGRFLVAQGYNPSGSQIEIGQWLRVWDLDRPELPPVSLLERDASTTAFVIHPGGDRLSATVSRVSLSGEWPAKFSIRSWDLNEPRRPPEVIERDAGPADRIDVASGGRRLVVYGFDPDQDIVQLWDLDRPERPPVIPFAKNRYPSSAPHPDGRRLLLADAQGTIFAVDPSAPSIVPTPAYRMPDGAGAQLQVHPDGRRFVVAGPDGTIYLGDLEHPDIEPVVLRGHGGAVLRLTFLPDRKHLLSTGNDGTVRVWALDVDELLGIAERRAGRNFRRAEWDRSFPGRGYRKTFDRLPEPRG